MASFEPVVIVYGSPEKISAVNLRFPISIRLVFDPKTLEGIVEAPCPLSEIYLQRYFLILFESVDRRLSAMLEKNERVISIYYPDQHRLQSTAQTHQAHEVNQVYRQLTLDVTSDIIEFLTRSGKNQLALERVALTKIYFKQARMLKEWAMSSFRAEPSHILLIPLNSSDEKMANLQRGLEQCCHDLGYESIRIRQLKDYIPDSDRCSTLLPYARQLFEYESLNYLVRMLRDLSAIRLYVYGNRLADLKEWSSAMIEREERVMDDEDNWCAFLQSEDIDDAVKWNFALVVAKKWKVNQIAPVSFEQLVDDPRFRSAVHRAHRTFAERQMEVTAQIFEWYDECLKLGCLHPEPRLVDQPFSNKTRSGSTDEKHTNSLFISRRVPLFDYPRLSRRKSYSITFIWLDEFLSDCPQMVRQVIEPYQWQFFQGVSSAVAFIETQLREHCRIVLVTSGRLGREFFDIPFSLKDQIYAAYVFCGQLQPNLDWSAKYSVVRGVFNDLTALSNQIKNDYRQLHEELKNRPTSSAAGPIMATDPLAPLPLTVYVVGQIDQFVAHQRTIDNLLCMPQTDESRLEMIEEFRRTWQHDPATLEQIEIFAGTYQSHLAIQWYTRDSFVWRTINQALRNSDPTSMYRLRYILTDMYNHLCIYSTIDWGWPYENRTQMLYRGQGMSTEEFDHFQKLRGSIIAINTFLSTTSSMQIALLYAGKYLECSEMVPVVFNIEIAGRMRARPHVNISSYSLFPDEDETLMAMGSVFRVGTIRLLPDSDSIWLINLKLLDRSEYEQLQQSVITSSD